MQKLIQSLGTSISWLAAILLAGVVLLGYTWLNQASNVKAAQPVETDPAVNIVTGNAPHAQDVSADGIWRDEDEVLLLQNQADRLIVPDRYRLVAADITKLDSLLSLAPMENSPAAKTTNTILTLPLPDGTFGRFNVQEYAVMEPALAAVLPQVKTYLGRGLDDPTATIRLDRTPAGFHGMILASTGTVYIDPYSRGDIEHYISYYKRDYGNYWGKVPSEQPPLPNPAWKPENLLLVPAASTGDILRTYRLAVAATVEYTTFHGGTAAQGQAAIVTTINRVNGIYEREFAVRLTLVGNNINVVFAAEPDGLTDGDDNQMVNAIQGILDATIGFANYDVGHVFGVNGAGIASFAAVCSAVKGEGVSQVNPPTGDPFDVDYVAHEMGHQFGANHSYNNASGVGGCTTRNAATAFEPGSGVTIMSYVGICGTQNLASNAIDKFHTGSHDQVAAFITNAATGGSCAQQAATGNNIPTVDAGPNRTIPKQTPFTLVPNGVAIDLDGEAPTYDWEEFDVGPTWTNSPVLPNSDSIGSAVPILRSYNPTANTIPFRTVPTIADVLDGTYQNIGESLPTIARTLNFRLTVRDNSRGLSNDSMQVSVASGAGPFRVTKPITSTVWTANAPHTITWDVANTTAAPVSCANVFIAVATDGGANIATYTLLATVPNSGSYTLPAGPATTTTQGRISVTCADNIFFDISHGNFTVQSAGLSIDKSLAPTTNIKNGDTVTYTIIVANTSGVDANSVQVTDNLPTGLAGNNLNTTISLTAGQSTTLIVTATVTANSGTNINNIVSYQHASRSGQDAISFTVSAKTTSTFLPIILKQ